MATNSILLQKLIAVYAARGYVGQFYQADPAVVTVTAGGTQAVITCTFINGGSGAVPTAGSITQGLWMLQATGLGTQAVPTTVNAVISDGTSTETVDVIPAPTAAVAGRGFTYQGSFQSNLVNVSNILTLTITVTLTGTQITTSAFQAVAVGNP